MGPNDKPNSKPRVVRRVPFGRSAAKARIQRRSSSERPSSEPRSTYPIHPYWQFLASQCRRHTVRSENSVSTPGDKSQPTAPLTESPTPAYSELMSILDVMDTLYVEREDVRWSIYEEEEMSWA